MPGRRSGVSISQDLRRGRPRCHQETLPGEGRSISAPLCGAELGQRPPGAGPGPPRLVGGKASILQRNQAWDLASAVRASEQQGKAQVESITDGEEPAEMTQGLAPGLTPVQANAHAVALEKVSDPTGQMNLTRVADSSAFAMSC